MSKESDLAKLEKRVAYLENSMITQSRISYLETRVLEVMYRIADLMGLPRSELDFRDGRDRS